MDKIKEGLDHDPQARILMELTKQGKTRQFWVEEGLIIIKVNQAYWQGLRKEIIKDCHDSKWASYSGISRTLALIEHTYYWPQMYEDVELYLKTSLVCQQDKNEHSSQGFHYQLALGIFTYTIQAMGERFNGFHYRLAQVRGVWQYNGRGGLL